MKEQRISSAATSLNQIPAAFNQLNKALARPEAFWAGITDCLDYGGGRYDTFSDRLAEMRVRNWVYDPYNRSAEHNAFVRKMLWVSPADIAFCCSVLNVIREPEVRQDVLRDIARMVKPDSSVIISVYEGNGTSRGRKTSKGWQANRKLKNYVKEVQQVFPYVELVPGKFIRAHTGYVNEQIL